MQSAIQTKFSELKLVINEFDDKKSTQDVETLISKFMSCDVIDIEKFTIDMIDIISKSIKPQSKRGRPPKDDVFVSTDDFIDSRSVSDELSERVDNVRSMSNDGVNTNDSTSVPVCLDDLLISQPSDQESEHIDASGKPKKEKVAKEPKEPKPKKEKVVKEPKEPKPKKEKVVKEPKEPKPKKEKVVKEPKEPKPKKEKVVKEPNEPEPTTNESKSDVIQPNFIDEEQSIPTDNLYKLSDIDDDDDNLQNEIEHSEGLKFDTMTKRDVQQLTEESFENVDDEEIDDEENDDDENDDDENDDDENDDEIEIDTDDL
jgi:hypothetical protein